MSETGKNTLTKSDFEIRIAGLNTDKTRTSLGSSTIYQVYFQLSQAPPLAWRDIFGREWKDLNPLQEAGIDGEFLVMHCPLQEVASIHLPALKKAVGATNIAYKQHAREQATEDMRKANVWGDERKTVEDMARSLDFE
ncbi:hypothetical protein FBQ87_01255 [Sphingobacteriales bacterium CHB3]|nr:hypothetical protein [Sphingobacteriales bacterium CHB3]